MQNKMTRSAQSWNAEPRTRKLYTTRNIITNGQKCTPCVNIIPSNTPLN